MKSIKQNAIPLPLSEEFLLTLEGEERSNGHANGSQKAGKNDLQALQEEDLQPVSQEGIVREDVMSHDAQDHRATFTEPPLRQTEKRRVSS